MKLKPSAFKENKLLTKEFKKTLISDDDEIFLED